MDLATSSQETKTKVTNSSTKMVLFIAKVVAVLGITGGVALHFFGYITHQSYLSAWGISPSMFPKPIDWTQITGYYTLFELSWTFSLATFQNWKEVALWCLGGTIFAFLLITLHRWNPPPQELSFSPKYLQNMAMGFFASIFLCFVIPLMLFILALGLALLAIPGETYGKKLALKDQQAFQKDCASPEKGYSCVEVKKQDITLSKGYLIDSSATHIAIFDTTLKKARVLELENTELIFDMKQVPGPL